MRSTKASDLVRLGAGAEEDRLERLRGVREAQERPVARARVGLGADEVDRVGGAQHQRALAVVEPDDALAVDRAQDRAALGEVSPSPAIRDSWLIAARIMAERVVRFKPAPSAAAATASAISARGRTESTATNSSGWWACPPRGPSPSTVSAIVPRPCGWRRWRRRGRRRSAAPPSSPQRRPDEPLGGDLARSPSRASAGPAPPRARPRRRSAGPARAPPRAPRSRSPRRSQTSSPAAGTTLNASPARTTVGHRGQPVGAGRVASPRRPAAPPRPARAGRCGPSPAPSPECAATPRATHPQRRRRLALRDHRLLPAGSELAGLEAQAGVVAGEAGRVAEAAGPPLLVDDGEQRELGEALRDLRRARASPRAPARSRPSCRPRPSRPAARRRARAAGARRGRRRCRGGRAAGRGRRRCR